MPEPLNPWEYDAGAKRYRDTATGRFLSREKATELRNTTVDGFRSRIEGITSRLVSGEIGVRAWQDLMNSEIGRLHTAEYLFGRGGRRAMTPTDREMLGNIIHNQRLYLWNFANQISAGALSEAQIHARAALYGNAGTAAYEFARAEAFGISERLPQVPGDGQTVCKVNCRCRLDIREDKSQWRVYWLLGTAEHCDDCKELAAKWAPLELSKT